MMYVRASLFFPLSLVDTPCDVVLHLGSHFAKDCKTVILAPGYEQIHAHQNNRDKYRDVER